jgi:hypothetical protein
MKSVLLDYAREAAGQDYFSDVVYDREHNMSIYINGDDYLPIIDAPSVNMGVMTKTEVAREKDDAFPIILATETKTLSYRESDDQGPYYN